ncbi:MAG TPA: MMPL family transporter, partial [Candidatus Poseidoniaceae archaeon]|nr:MMPL family transporter [Candidatus Poseidoniaceae archaeon]
MASLVSCALIAIAMPVELVLNTDSIFIDPAKERIREEGLADNYQGQLILKISHDNDDVSVTSNFSLVKELIQLEAELLDGTNPDTSWEYSSTVIVKLETPFAAWEEAFNSRNKSFENSTKWSEVLDSNNTGGWCGNQSTAEENSAFQTTMLLLPKDSNYGIACPSFPGADERLPPDANEILWMVWLDSSDPDDRTTNWNTLDLWASKVSENTEFQVDAVGVNMLFQKSKGIAENDLNSVLIPSLFILIVVMYLIIRDIKVCAVTLSSVGLIIAAEIGIMSIANIPLSIIDAIAFPIILAVAVDGAFWYCKSSRSREEVRSVLLLAMVTTLAAVSLSLFSPIKAQSSLALIMIIGVFLDWLVTRFVLEEFYMSRRNNSEIKPLEIPTESNAKMKWGWPLSLTFLAVITLISPTGVEVLDIHQFLAEDDPALEEFEDLQEQYLIASSAISWIIIDVEGDSHDDYVKVVNIQKQLGQHPSIISFETGLYETPLVMGIQFGFENQQNATIDSVSLSDAKTPVMDDHRLQRNGKTTGYIIAVFIDGSNANAALRLQDDVSDLIERYDAEYTIGGELVTGASLAEDFDNTRVFQILAAGICVFLIATFVSKSPVRAMRIAIGTVAIGSAVDGFASLIG